MPGEGLESFGLTVQQPLAGDNTSLGGNTPIAGTPNLSARIVASAVAHGDVLYGDLPPERVLQIELLLERHSRAQQEVQSLSSEIQNNCLQSVMLASAAVVLGVNSPLNWPAMYTLSIIGLIGAYKLYKAGVSSWEIPGKKQNVQRLGQQFQNEVNAYGLRQEDAGGGGTPDEVLEEGRVIPLRRVASGTNLWALDNASNAGSQRYR